jgi:hypothetical protein
MPSLKQKIANFIRSFVWHVYAGLPKSSQQIIDERFSICNSCEMFDKKASQCMICGCNINTKKTFMNKLAWLDQKCPEGKW